MGPATATGGLDRGDLAHPALLLGFLESVGEAGVDLLQPRVMAGYDARVTARREPSDRVAKLSAART
jgi:hypothetical protein